MAGYTSLFSTTDMNCKRCHAGIPENVAFCPQCGSPTEKAPFFQPEPGERQHTGTGTHLLIGCACVLGALTVMGLIVGLAMFVLVSVDSELHTEKLHTKELPSLSVAGGSEFELYGKTIDGEDFDWESLRGKYVLVKFTATWCPPCKMEIPGMLDAYKKYHDKGLEIVSVYIWEQEPAAVETVKQHVEKEKLPWIILSESLTKKAGQVSQGEHFNIQSVPTMILIDKEGRIINSQARGKTLQRELEKVFDEQ
jgi:thiol-disulfide isomerase/thioredoxin